VTHRPEHRYAVRLRWAGNLGPGTASYRAYSRDHEIAVGERPPIAGSSDPAFRGDAARYNPEELLVASLAACHMLWYLHLCADAGVVVTGYADEASGTMVQSPDGGGEFADVVLRPHVTIADGGDTAAAMRLHTPAHELCFIARSVRFPVRCEPSVRVEPNE